MIVQLWPALVCFCQLRRSSLELEDVYFDVCQLMPGQSAKLNSAELQVVLLGCEDALLGASKRRTNGCRYDTPTGRPGHLFFVLIGQNLIPEFSGIFRKTF
jgi:hypothetical protein